jgi:photosystem II stability/assembly factor-like uncharacterized protein
MPRSIRLITLVLVLLLAGCSRSHPQPTSQATVTEQPPLPATGTPLPTEIPPTPTGEEVSLPEPTATVDLSQILQGPAEPLLPAGTEVDIREVHLLNDLDGWSLTLGPGGMDHVLKTADGGESWSDITPPQPLSPYSTRSQVYAAFSDLNSGWVFYQGSNLIWATADGGLTWTPSQLEYETQGGGLLFSLDPNQVWLFQFVDAGMQKVYTVVYGSQDGGSTWTKLLDPYTDTSIQDFDKTGITFLNPDFGWLTRNFRGVAIYVYLDITRDGGQTWENLDMPAPPSAPDAFSNCACGLYDPYLRSQQEGTVRLSCTCYEGDQNFVKNYLYHTQDGGADWEISYIPEGELYYLGGQTFYTIGRDINRSTDGGVEWDLMKSVNWDGQFSFIDENHALAVAYNPDQDIYALVRTKDGCQSFEIVTPKLVASQTQR